MIYSGLLGFHDTTSWCDATMHKRSYLTEKKKKCFPHLHGDWSVLSTLNPIKCHFQVNGQRKCNKSSTDLCKWGHRLLPRGPVIDAFSLPLWELYRYSGDIESLQIEIIASPTKKKKKKPFKVYLQNTCTHIRVHKCDFTR